MTTTPRDPRQGRRYQAFARSVVARSEVCHLCGRVACRRGCCPRANVCDHLEPIAVAPDRCFDPTNAAPAHACCNRKRGDLSLARWFEDQGPSEPHTRIW